MRVVAGRYAIVESLGSGGMAHVHKARDAVLERDVALKLLRDDIGRDEVLRERFLRESRLAGSLAHRHIIRVYDAGLDGDTPWMAMELVDGPSLRERMNEAGPMAQDEAVRVMGEVLEALAAAHDADVIHRDIKPANILLGTDGAKLGDFGIAKSLRTTAGDLTQINQFIGTPKYTAPEVATGDAATARSDLYAAGVLLWEMLAGHPPFEHDNPLTLAMMHRTDPLPSLAAARPDVAPAMIGVVEAALAKDPAARPRDAATMRGMLLAAASGAEPEASAATMALPRVAAPVPPRADPTKVVGDRTPLRPPRPPATATPPPVDPPAKGGGWGVAILVASLLVAAVVAFTLAGSDSPAGPEATPAPTPTATTPEVPVDPAPPTLVEPTSAPTTAEPTATPTPTPTPEPEPTETVAPSEPEPTTTPTPEPTDAPTDDGPLLPLPLPGDDDDGDDPSPQPVAS